MARKSNLGIRLCTYELCTGAIMAVPAHDERDWEFAKKFNLPIIQVVAKNGEEVVLMRQHLQM